MLIAGCRQSGSAGAGVRLIRARRPQSAYIYEHFDQGQSWKRKQSGKIKDRKKPIEQYEHKGKKRAPIPPVGLVNPQTDPVAPTRKTYRYDPHLDPQLAFDSQSVREAVARELAKGVAPEPPEARPEADEAKVARLTQELQYLHVNGRDELMARFVGR